MMKSDGVLTGRHKEGVKSKNRNRQRGRKKSRERENNTQRGKRGERLKSK